MEEQRMFLNKEKLYVLFSAIVILFTSWTIYYNLPYGFFFNIILTTWTLAKFNPLSIAKIKLFISFFIIAMWFYVPYDIDIKSLMIGMMSAIIISVIFIIDDRTIRRILDVMFTLIAGIVTFGLVAHILRFLNIYEFPQIALIKTGDDRVYSVFLLHVYEELSSGVLVSFRFNSIFDEPGYLGTITALYLIYQDFDFKKPINIFLLLGGIFTLSLAFYILTFPFLILKFIKKPRLFELIFFSIIIVLFITQLSGLLDIFLRRQEFYGGEFSTSRGGWYDIKDSIMFLHNQDFFHLLFGNGYNAHRVMFIGTNSHGMDNSSIFRLFFQIGILGVINFILFIIYNVKKDKKSIFFIIAFIFSLYQRPQVFEPIFILLLAANMKLATENPYRAKIIKDIRKMAS